MQVQKCYSSLEATDLNLYVLKVDGRQLFTVIMNSCRTEMRSYSSGCYRRTLRSSCQSFIHPLWVWHARGSVSSTGDLEVFLLLSTTKDTYLIFLKTGEFFCVFKHLYYRIKVSATQQTKLCLPAGVLQMPVHSFSLRLNGRH